MFLKIIVKLINETEIKIKEITFKATKIKFNASHKTRYKLIKMKKMNALQVLLQELKRRFMRESMNKGFDDQKCPFLIYWFSYIFNFEQHILNILVTIIDTTTPVGEGTQVFKICCSKFKI